LPELVKAQPAFLLEVFHQTLTSPEPVPRGTASPRPATAQAQASGAPLYRIHDGAESQSAAAAKANPAPISTQPQHKPIIAHYKSRRSSVARL